MKKIKLNKNEKVLEFDEFIKSIKLNENTNNIKNIIRLYDAGVEMNDNLKDQVDAFFYNGRYFSSLKNENEIQSILPESFLIANGINIPDDMIFDMEGEIEEAEKELEEAGSAESEKLRKRIVGKGVGFIILKKNHCIEK